jgi:dihydroflavonol-4-reductase
MLDESVFWKTSGNESDYALSKYNAEREVWRGMEEGLNAVIVNPGVILGPGFWSRSSGRLFEAGLTGHRFYTEGRAAYVAAVDVAEFMHQLVSGKHFGTRYLLIENNYQFKDVFTWINAGLGHSGPKISAGRVLLNMARLLEFCWNLFSKRERKLSKALINAAFSNQEFSNRKIRETLGINFKPTREAINETCKMLLLELGKRTKS